MRPTGLDEPASSAAFDRISENSLSVYLFEASLKGEVHADKEDLWRRANAIGVYLAAHIYSSASERSEQAPP